MRRKKGSLVPLEFLIIEAAKELKKKGIEEFHGYQIGKMMCGRGKALFVVGAGYGTLYRALGRLQKFGILSSRWEQVEENRPRRRYYKLLKETR